MTQNEAITMKKKSRATPPAINNKNPINKVNYKVKRAAELLSTQPEHALQLAMDVLATDAENAYMWVVAMKAHQRLGQFSNAEECINKALEIYPGYIDAIYAKSDLLYESERFIEAEVYLLHTISRLSKKESRPLRTLLATILQKLKRYEQAEKLYFEIAKEEPDNCLYWNNLGLVNQDLSRFEEMESAFQKACQLSKHDPTPFFNYIVGSHYHPGKNAEQILELCKKWQAKFKPGNVSRAVAKNKSANKRLRIGIISDGFRAHPVGKMITEGLSYIPQSHMEFYAYSTNYKEDGLTARIKNICASWRVVEGILPAELDKIIRGDEIDILFDLCGYNMNSRMRNFQLAPAPVQIKWVGGLISSTGLDTMDYLLSDNIETPPGIDDKYTEKLIRLPDDYICYDPPSYLPEVNSAPVHSNGYITFGCFNNASKINDVLLAQWASVLKEVPESRLFLKSFNFENDALKEYIFTTLGNNGIARERLRIEGSSPHRELLACYNHVDIALDPWPYSGGLTTCEAMAMGVPVVTLPGPTFAGRHSASHLVNAGMEELVADSWEQYISIAVGLTKDLDSLTIIRKYLREILLSSPVCDGERFAKNFSNAMRAVWQRHCEGKPPAALTLTKESLPYFHDDDEPVVLQHPMNIDAEVKKPDSDFHFQVAGKVMMMDYGGRFAHGPALINLTATKGVHAIIMDTLGSVAEEFLPLNKESLHHIKLHALGDGTPTPIYMCLDNNYSSDLKPVMAASGARETLSDKTVVTEFLTQTARLDEIQGLDYLDWFILDNKFNLGKTFAYGARILSNCLLIDIRFSFEKTHEGQMLCNEVSELLKGYGFAFHSLKAVEHGRPVILQEEKTLPSSRTVAVDAIYIPDAKRLTCLSNAQREKLAFILHAGYGMQDITYLVLKENNEERASKYLDDLTCKAQGTSAAAMNAAVIPEMPRMSEGETELFEKYLHQATLYFEYGSGGSTKLAVKNKVEVFGVESDKQWVDTLIEECGPLCKVDYVDIGPTKEWGYPVDQTHKEKFPLYSEAILRHENAFDFVLVDGRFRVACTLNVIKHTLACKKGKADTIIFIHDFWNRSDYYTVLAFLDTVERKETAGVFKLKNNIDMLYLNQLLEKYKYIPA